MKVHPAPRKRNIRLRYDAGSALSGSTAQKKLRRLPHIFAKVLELPFHSDADVSVEETPGFFRFVVTTDDGEIGGDVRAHAVEIYPGVTKIVIRGNGGGGGLDGFSVGELELDMWRFRLPDSTRPEMASAACNDGELVVTVPKDAAEFDGSVADDGEGDNVWGEGSGDNIGAERLVLVQ